MTLTRWLSIASVSLAIGCATLLAPIEAFVPESAAGRAVAVVRKDAWWVGGRGAVIGPDLVLTVKHVLPDGVQAYVSTAATGRGWIDATIVGELPASPEAVLVLRVETDRSALGQLLSFSGFSGQECYTIGDGAPETIATARGDVRLLGGSLQPGDSGSPVVDRDGDLVGLLCGRNRGVPVVATIDGPALHVLLRGDELTRLGRSPGVLVASMLPRSTPHPLPRRAVAQLHCDSSFEPRTRAR